MKNSLLAGVSFFAVAALAWGGSVRGEYVEARTADVYTGACFANGEVNLVGDLAVFGWRIDKGVWQGVNLDGLSVVGAVKAGATLGDRYHTAFPVRSILIVDQRASAEQRLALKSFAQRMSNDLLQDIVRVEYQPISLTFEGGNLHSAAATLVAGTLAKIQTRALEGGDHICHNEEVWYPPLTELDHAMPAFTLANEYHGEGLNTTWSTPPNRSSFVGSFQYRD
ncbi:MAG: DUF1326 domain-containing protein [Acidobacteria bacterium]|nr:DUF1326 domain-containing protein [Acidobacteriota bacterium]